MFSFGLLSTPLPYLIMAILYCCMLIFPNRGTQKKQERFQEATSIGSYSSNHFVPVPALEDISFSAEANITQEPEVIPPKFSNIVKLKQKSQINYLPDDWNFAMHFRPPPVHS